MKLHQLELLCALEQYHSFSRTAEHLFLSQPALSASLRALEKELHCTLLTRSNKGIQFTPVGKRALAIALTCIDLLLQLFRQVRIGGSEAFVNLQEIDEHTLIHQLSYGTLDFAILQINMIADDTETHPLELPIPSIELAREPIVVLCSKTHPLAEMPAIPMRSLLAYPFVTAHAETDRRLINMMQTLNAGQPVLEIRDTFSLNRLIAEGRHWAFVPQSERHRHQNDLHHALTTRPLSDLSCRCSYLWLRGNNNYPEEETVLLQSSRTLLHEKLINKEASL